MFAFAVRMWYNHIEKERRWGNAIVLSEKELLIYNYIERFLDENGFPPTVRDICRNTGIKSTSTVYAYIGRLEEKGVIERTSGKSRALNPVSRAKQKDAIRVPVIGRVTAGLPVFAIENHEGYVDFDPQGRRYRKDELFALKVRGESMIEAGILDGDIVVVRKTETAENGDIVVALIDDSATVKTFYRENGRFRLQPENSTMKPIYAKELSILGHVVASVRYYD